MIENQNIKKYIKLWQESLSGVVTYVSPKIMLDYIYHTTTVAKAAQTIAEKCGLDAQKAFVLGFLHDYGKIQNERMHTAHFLEGYNRMMSLGYPDIAKVCLSHCFPIKDFDDIDYTSYKKSDLTKAREILSQIEYDDYDRLIQFCDILSEARGLVSYKKRLEHIRSRYNLTKEQTSGLEKGAKNNKAYFDNLCCCDTYDLLNINDVK